jgi:Tol biopolymer transport system component
MPETHSFVAVSTDGKTLLTSRNYPENQIPSLIIFLVTAGGNPVEVFKGTDNILSARGLFSPDGSKVIVSLAIRDPKVVAGTSNQFEVLEVATGKSTRIKHMPSDGWLADWDWSPKGDRLAYMWRHPRANAGFGGGTEDKVYVSDTDGSNAKEIHKATGFNVHTLIWR